MTDYYTTLGVDKNASQEEIKKAYKKLANKHHPDKGGDQAKFKDIAAAYDTIGDPEKRSQYDQQQTYGAHGFNTHHFTHDFHDIFGQHFHGNPFFGDMFRRQQVHKNRDLNLQCTVSFVDSYTGKKLESKYTLLSGKSQTVVIDVPAGVNNGDSIRYSGLGDDSISNIPRGDLNITFIVEPDIKFDRRGDDVYTTIEINAIEAMIGCRKQVKSVTGETMMLDIRPGVETGTEFAKTGAGFKNLQNHRKGRFVSVIKIKPHTITNPEIVNQLQQILNQINS